jgi:hypothetical protein
MGEIKFILPELSEQLLQHKPEAVAHIFSDIFQYPDIWLLSS